MVQNVQKIIMDYNVSTSATVITMQLVITYLATVRALLVGEMKIVTLHVQKAILVSTALKDVINLKVNYKFIFYYQN